MKLKVYISLPIQGKDLERQKKYAQDIAERLAICGCEPVNPFDNFLPDDAPRAAVLANRSALPGNVQE